MADIVITSSNVVPGADAPWASGLLGETGTAGQAVYLDKSGAVELVKLAQATNLAASRAVGVLTNGGSSGQSCRYQTLEEMTLGTTMLVGSVLAVSSNAGGIAPIADVTTGCWITPLCVVSSGTKVKLQPFRSGVQRP